MTIDTSFGVYHIAYCHYILPIAGLLDAALQAMTRCSLCHRMCLFLQSQDFQRHTEFIINSLYTSSQHAAEQLDAVDSHLAQSLSAMGIMAGKLSSVQTAQKQQLQLSQQNLKGVQQLHLDSQQVRNQLAHALQNEVHICSMRLLTNYYAISVLLLYSRIVCCICPHAQP